MANKVSISKTLIAANNDATGLVQVLKTTPNGELKCSIVHSGDDDGEANAANQVKVIKNLSIDNSETDGTGIGKFFGDSKGLISDTFTATLNAPRMISMALENDAGLNRGLPHVLSTNASTIQGVADVSGTYAKTNGANTWTALNLDSNNALNTNDNATTQGEINETVARTDERQQVYPLADNGANSVALQLDSAKQNSLKTVDQNLEVVLGEVSLIDGGRLKTKDVDVAFIHSDGALSTPATQLIGWTDEATAPYGRSIRCSEKGQLHSQLLGLTDITDQTTHQYLKVETNGSLNTKDSGLDKITTGSDTVLAADNATLQRVLVMGKSNGSGNLTALECDGDRLRVETELISGNAQFSGGTKTQEVGFQVYGTNGTQMRTLKCNDTGNLEVITSGSSPIQGNDGNDGAGTDRTIKTDATGVLLVSPVGGGTLGDATAANQVLQLARLPASLGSKSQPNSLSTCRDSTQGEYDLSARTTIGTASTSTRLACNVGGALNTFSNENNYINVGATTINANSFALTQSLNANHQYIRILFKSASQPNSDLVVFGSNDTTNFFALPNQDSGTNDYSLSFNQIGGAGSYYASFSMEKGVPKTISVFNSDTVSSFAMTNISFMYGY